MIRSSNILIRAMVLISIGLLTAQMGMSQSKPRANPPAATQQESEGQSRPPNDKKQTLLGCLTKAQTTVSSAPSAAQPGSKGSSSQSAQGLSNPKAEGTVASAPPAGFILKRQGTEQEIPVEGLSQLSLHAGHTVQLTGTMTQKNGKDTLEVSEIKHVAYSCPGKPGLSPAENRSKNPAGSGY